MSADEDAPGTGKRLPISETPDLISSEKVHDTGVYDPDEERLGTVRSLMVDKRSGQVHYVVLSFGGVLGVGERYFPLPWRVLRYDEALGGYIVGLKKEVLRQAPSFAAGDEPAFTPEYAASIYHYYEDASPEAPVSGR